MPKMKELVVRAGKYFSVGLLCMACLPVLLPSLFFLSFFGFAFLLPTVCALAGFLYLRKYVGMLYRKLPISILAAGCSPWRGRRHSQESVAPAFLIDFPRRDLNAIETFEVVDPEFDAVLITTAPREVQRENTEGGRDADSLAGLGAVLGTDVSADHATRIEGLGVDAIPSDAATVRESDDDNPLVENTENTEGGRDADSLAGLGAVLGADVSADHATKIEGLGVDAIPSDAATVRESDDDNPLVENTENTEGGRDADSLAGLGAVLGTDVSADHATRIEGLGVDAIPSDAATVRESDDDDPLVENGSRGQGTDDDSSFESGTRGQGTDDDAEIGTSRELREDDTSAEGTIKEQIEGDTIAEDETRRQGIVEATSAENGNRKHGVDDEMITEGIVKVAYAEDGKRKQGIDEDTSADDANERTGIVEETFAADDGNRKKRRVEATSTEDRNRSEGIDEVLPTEDATKRDGIHDHISATDGSRREGVDEDTSVENITRRHVREDGASIENGTGRDEGEDDTSVEAETRRWGRDDDQQSEEEIGGTAVVEGSELREVAGSKQLLEDKEGEGDEVEHPNEDNVERDVLVDTERDDGFQSLPIGANSRGSGGTQKGENISPEVSEIEEKGYESEVEPEPEDKAHPEVVKEEQEDNDGVNKALDGEAKEQEIESLPDECNLPQALDEDDQERTSASSTAAAPVTPAASPVASRVKPEGVKDLLPHQADENDIWICNVCGWKYPNAKPSAKIRRNHKKHCKGSRSPGAGSSQDEGMNTETPQQNESATKSKKDLKASGPLAGSLDTEDDDNNSLHDHNSNGVAFDDDGGGAAVSSANSRGYVGQSSGVEPESFRSVDFEFPSNTSESFRSADFDFPLITSESTSSVDEGFSEVRWASFPSVESHFHDEQDQLDQLLQFWRNVESNEARSVGDPKPARKAFLWNRGGILKPESSTHPKVFQTAGQDARKPNRNQLHGQITKYLHNCNFFFDKVSCHVQVKQELQLSEDLNAVKGIVGDKHVSTGPLLADIEELSEFLGIDLPPKSADLPEIEWAKLAIEVMKVVVGID